MNGAKYKSERGAVRHAVVAAMAALALCLPASGLMGQRQQQHSRPAERPQFSAPRQQTRPESPRGSERPAQRYQAPQYSPRAQQYQGRPAPQYQGRPAPQYQPRGQQYPNAYPNRGGQPQYQPRTAQPYPNQYQNRGAQPGYPQYGT